MSVHVCAGQAVPIQKACIPGREYSISRQTLGKLCLCWAGEVPS